MVRVAGQLTLSETSMLTSMSPGVESSWGLGRSLVLHVGQSRRYWMLKCASHGQGTP